MLSISSCAFISVYSGLTSFQFERLYKAGLPITNSLHLCFSGNIFILTLCFKDILLDVKFLVNILLSAPLASVI